MERSLDCIARQLFQLATIQDMHLDAISRAHHFLDAYGNLLVEETTAAYISAQAEQLRKSVSHARCSSSITLKSLSSLPMTIVPSPISFSSAPPPPHTEECTPTCLHTAARCHACLRCVPGTILSVVFHFTCPFLLLPCLTSHPTPPTPSFCDRFVTGSPSCAPSPLFPRFLVDLSQLKSRERDQLEIIFSVCSASVVMLHS